MSDLGRLFRFGAVGREPLENFTTAALAIAINRDDRPIKRALLDIDWHCETGDGDQSVRPPCFISDETAAITADTQVTLWPEADLPICYLDLVLHLKDVHNRQSDIWIEVKVDAFESGNQIAEYQRHAKQKKWSSTPRIITLGRLRVSDKVPALKWSSVVEAIGSVCEPHYTWLSLREFLVEEKIAWLPWPTGSLDVSRVAEVIVGVNRRVRAHWSTPELTWIVDGALRNMVNKSASQKQDLVATAGPLRYGLVFEGERWDWSLGITPQNYQRVPLDARQTIRDADVGGLSAGWLRHPHRSAVLERRLPMSSLASLDDVVAWFDEGLRELCEAKVLDRFIAGLATRALGSREADASNGQPALPTAGSGTGSGE